MSYRYTDEEQQDTKRFESRFQAHITESKEYRRAAYIRPSWDYSQYRAGTAMHEMEHRVEPLVAIHLPREQFDQLMDDYNRMNSWRDEANYAKTILTNQRKDEQVRYNNPAVAKAYRNYQMLLELCRK
jgi:hypothetical protein